MSILSVHKEPLLWSLLLPNSDSQDRFVCLFNKLMIASYSLDLSGHESRIKIESIVGVQWGQVNSNPSPSVYM